jgi:prophage maintenance system killer protein
MPFNQEIFSSFNLTSLVEFNPALVYGFLPEASVRAVANDPNTVEYLLHGANQYQDMLNAYLYAQNEILPAIRKTGLENIASDQILYWLDQIHFYAAATLANDYFAASGQKDFVAGQSTKRQVIRWHYGNQFKKYLHCYLSDENISLIKAYAIEKNINENDLKKFLIFLRKLRDDQTIKVQEYETHDQINSVYQQGTFTLDKLVKLYHTNQLSLDEKSLVAKFVKICPEPASLPEMREKFAKTFLAELKECQPNNTDQVANFITTSFYRITEDHWYPNGNGRTATCFINTFLRALNKPSILMRNPKDRNDPQSSYSQAIANIDNNIILLHIHIKKRISDAENGKQFQDVELAQIVTLRVKLSKVATIIKQKFPDCKINDGFSSLMVRGASLTLRSQQPTQREIINCLEWMLNLTIYRYGQLEKDLMIKKHHLQDDSKNSFAQGLRRAAAKNETQDMLYFLASCDINQQDTNPNSKKTALHCAVITKSLDAVTLLLQKGADTSIQDVQNKTALDYAIEKHHDEIIELLQQNQMTINHRTI